MLPACPSRPRSQRGAYLHLSLPAKLGLGAAVASLDMLVACAAPRPTLRSDYDRATNFSNYRTYSYVSNVGTDKSGYSTLITQHFEDAIDTELNARGYRKVETDPDLLVNPNANAMEKTDMRSMPTPALSLGLGYYGYRSGLYAGMPLFGTDIDTVRHKVGTADIDLDARQKKLIWTGVAEGGLSEESMTNPQPAIAKVVNETFTQFPGRAGVSH